MSLAVTFGVREDTRAWVMDLRAVPHWMIVGATQTGKSTLVHGDRRGAGSVAGSAGRDRSEGRA
jgi:hypothetical protein